MKNLIINRGIPGSGKSTLAKKIKASYYEMGLTCVSLSSDDYYTVDGYYFWHPTKVAYAHSRNRWLCEQCMQREINAIIIDNTNIKFKEIEPYIILAAEYGYVVDVTESNTEWSKNAKLCHEKNIHKVPLETIEKMLNSFEPHDNIIRKINDCYNNHLQTLTDKDLEW